jgi:ABC-2 type transport system permease protein
MSVLTDVPLGAVGTAVVVVIVSNILGAIDALGGLREWLPTFNSNAWIGALNKDIEWGDMLRGTSYSIIAFTLLIGFAVYKFDRKDITS